MSQRAALVELALRANRTVGDRLPRIIVRQIEAPPLDRA
jgi:hypothetical protein